MCYICGILFGVKEPLANDNETHGICDECFPMVMENYKKEMEERRKQRDEQIVPKST